MGRWGGEGRWGGGEGGEVRKAESKKGGEGEEGGEREEKSEKNFFLFSLHPLLLHSPHSCASSHSKDRMRE